jgi:aspartate/glutamate racemase
MKKKSYLCFLTLIFTAGIFFNALQALTSNSNPENDAVENARMKVIGIIGGVSWVSSMEYYKRLNEMVRDSSNTMNSTCEIIQEKVDIPAIHIADVTGLKIKRKGIKTVALPGTKFTMENSFYKDRIHEKFEIKVVVPDPEEQRVGNQSRLANHFNGYKHDESTTHLNFLVQLRSIKNVLTTIIINNLKTHQS